MRTGPSRQLEVLKEISFSVRRGEFFGIVGRNGSGKSTLLQILAGIYHADAGRIRIAPRVAPVIDLGVGFQADLPAWENVALNAEIIGLTPKQARERFDDIIAFAELGEFLDLKLKNYSSGMRARLAFSIATHMDADILLLDEVLAVGDRRFTKKSEKTFASLREDPQKTVVLVTHSIATVVEFCDRAILIENGRIEERGDPERVARRYNEVLAQGPPRRDSRRTEHGARARIEEIWLEGADGDVSATVEADEAIHVHTVVEAAERIEGARLRLELRDADRTLLFAARPVHAWAGFRRRLRPGSGSTSRRRSRTSSRPAATRSSARPGRTMARAALRIARPGTTDFTVASGRRPVPGRIVLDHEFRVDHSDPTS